MAVHCLGGTVVITEKFDAQQALALIERYRVIHARFVPAMFVRMLRLPTAAREGCGLSSLRTDVHAAAPCPVEIKQQLIDWWGPIISGHCGATEGMGATFITEAEWLTCRGSVGRPLMGRPHVLGETGHELLPGAVSQIFFDGPGGMLWDTAPEVFRPSSSTDS